MDEFEEKDYSGARSCADAVKANGDAIMAIFDDVDATMNNLNGSNWESTGADSARDRYNTIRKNYDKFYSKIVDMKNHIYNVTAANEKADIKAGNIVTDLKSGGSL